MMSHLNEIKITDENRDTLMAEAEALGKAHVLALKDQMKRQAEK